LSAKEGIHAIIGKLKSDPKGATVVQNYMFELEKDWTMEKAKTWVKEHKDSADELTIDEIKAMLKDLEKRRTEIMEKLYPKTQLTEEQQQGLRGELTVLDAEMKAYTEFLTEKLGESQEHETAKSDALDPAVELARSRRYFHSNMSLFGTE
jgi:hypothetical protein